MVKKHVKSKPGFFGMMYYYDENGKYIGRSRPGLLDDTLVHFDESGKKSGGSHPGIFWDKVTTDERNKRKIISFRSLFYTFHKSEGKVIGKSRPHIMDRVYTEIKNDDEYLKEETPSEDKAIYEEIKESNIASFSSVMLKKIAKVLIGLICFAGALFFGIAVIAFLFGNNFETTMLIICICLSLLLYKIALWGLKSHKKND